MFRLKDHIPMAQGTSWQHICGAYEFHVPNHPTRRTSQRNPCHLSCVYSWCCFLAAKMMLHQTSDQTWFLYVMCSPKTARCLPLSLEFVPAGAAAPAKRTEKAAASAWLAEEPKRQQPYCFSLHGSCAHSHVVGRADWKCWSRNWDTHLIHSTFIDKQVWIDIYVCNAYVLYTCNVVQTNPQHYNIPAVMLGVD